MSRIPPYFSFFFAVRRRRSGKLEPATLLSTAEVSRVPWRVQPNIHEVFQVCALLFLAASTRTFILPRCLSLSGIIGLCWGEASLHNRIWITTQMKFVESPSREWPLHFKSRIKTLPWYHFSSACFSQLCTGSWVWNPSKLKFRFRHPFLWICYGRLSPICSENSISKEGITLDSSAVGTKYIFVRIKQREICNINGISCRGCSSFCPLKDHWVVSSSRMGHACVRSSFFSFSSYVSRTNR